MSTRQLQSHLRTLNSFTSRSNTYVAGLRGTPLSGAVWRQYQRAERTYNAKSTAFYESIKDLTIPTLNQTVGQYLSDLRGSRRSGDYRTFGELRRTPNGITGDESLRKLLDQMQRRADPRYLEREARTQRSILRQMLERTSNKELSKIVNQMSDEEVITLTQYTEFMQKLESSYAMAKSISSDTPRWQSSVYEDNEDSIQELIDWAHRHFGDTTQSDQDTDDSRTSSTRTGRDRYGRFVRKDTPNPEPKFARDSRGRFAPKS